MKEQTTEEKILAAAENEFMLKGYEAARTTSIAKEAGVTHAMLHYYFRSKENLFDKIIGGKIAELGELMLGTFGQHGQPLFEKIEIAIRQHFDFVASHPQLPIFFLHELYVRSERLTPILNYLGPKAEEIVLSLQSEIDSEVNAGRCRKVDARMLLLDIVSLNIFSFIAKPMVEGLLPDLFVDRERFLEERKKENIATIMRKLKV